MIEVDISKYFRHLRWRRWAARKIFSKHEITLCFEDACDFESEGLVRRADVYVPIVSLKVQDCPSSLVSVAYAAYNSSGNVHVYFEISVKDVVHIIEVKLYASIHLPSFKAGKFFRQLSGDRSGRKCFDLV